MKAFVVDKYKKKGALRLASVPEPEVQNEDVLVRIHATAVNLLDSKVRDGEFKLFLPYRPPFILGHDVAGIVVTAGANVRRFKVGDEVYARVRDHRIGTFAERIAITEADLALKPKNLSMVEAASIPLVGLTAWQALGEVVKVKPDQKVFIQAGSGGVGTFAIQLAKHLGATVATTTSSSNAELVKGLGADLIIDYKSQDFEKILSDYDLVLNSQDAKTLDKSLRMGLFFDAGNVWGPNKIRGVDYGTSFSLSDLRYSAGLSVAWNSPMGPLKFSYGNPFDTNDKDDIQRLQFQMGSSF